MTLLIVLVVVLLATAVAVAAGAFDGPRGVRRRRTVVRAPREVIVERPVQRSVVRERRVEDDPLL